MSHAQWLSHDKWLNVVTHAPLVSIDLILRDPENRVLLGWRLNEPAKNCWFTPGGAVRKDEHLDAAFSRIAATECGITIAREASTFLGVYEHHYGTNFAQLPGVSTHYVVLAYELRMGNSDTRSDAQHETLRWFSVNELLADPAVHPLVKQYPLHP